MQPAESPAAILGWVARAKGIAANSFSGDAENWLAANGAPDRARRIYKAAIGAGSTVDSAQASDILLGNWSDTLRTRSAFARILADGAFSRVPMNSRIGIVTVPATGSIVAEGDAIPVSRLTLTNFLLAPIKASALVVVTNELLRDVSSAGQQLFNREMLGAIADAVDSIFLDAIISTGSTSTASTGPTAADAKHDLRTALLAVNSIGAARLYWIAAPDVAKRASVLATTTGADAFTAMSATGGELAGLPAIVANGVPGGHLYLVDASGIAADGGPVTVEASGQADVQMSDAPTMDGTTPTAAALTSMFMSNSTALRATAWFGASVLRDDAVAEITDIAWGG
jgi:Phage capsid family